ncbi:LysM peptidoglycan-binding domain-containing protein [Bacilli bacterium]|nr:peptidoglycan-binding protein [Bacilli bacterium]PZD84936.1 peptidoglycan-binding protein [Bacilli bacterium]PZD87263.1 peptidoglycan-binding protein [Bacilli bacterium]RCO05465.1 LysM peptidoglycan-binding domain-containing protein [Bacilli bacterium]RCO08775.1 LysM peptidoglycan-binding domain-containing protein [Bacilli bacterium]
MMKLLLTISMIASLFTIPMSADAASYKIQEGDSFHSIAKKFSTTITNLQIANKRSGNVLYAGETIQVPDDIPLKDKELMAKLVHAEAKGEPYAGKVGVATVVLNRVDHKEFPDTIREVIYEKVGGAYAFTPVQNGKINGNYTDEDMKAVNEAIAYRGQSDGSIYFYNPKTSTSKWIFSRETTVTIGNHRFAK